ncbi:MAG: DUF86 domain-containing protein [Anaerolineales bacterium]|nr:DUF86 domain-containing protein [Anaerolineales bacterium]
MQQRIRDILSAIAEIQKFTRTMDYETFCGDDRTIRAVEMNFIIIGESANHIPEEFEEANLDIPWSLMRAMRNRVVHVYFSIDAKMLWDTIQNDLPPLIPKLENLL